MIKRRTTKTAKDMLRNYIIISWRNLLKNKSYSSINILGLALGIGGACLVFLLVLFETGFDKQHPDADRIYRVVLENNYYGKTYSQAIPYPVPESLRGDFDQFEAISIVDTNEDNTVITVQQGNQIERFKEEKGIAFVDPEFFEIFHYKWLSGDPKQALIEQRSVVISETLALKYFGDADPVGKMLNFHNRYDLKVTGVVEDHPKQTDIPFNMLISMNLGKEQKRGWDGWDASSGRVHCYLKLKPGIEVASINAQLEEYFGQHHHEEYAQSIIMFLQPLKDLHFDNRFDNFNNRTVSERTLWAMGLVGLSLLLTSCINFININTVLATNRSKEIGVRKVMGSARVQLILQFMTETLIITLISIVGAITLAKLGLVKMESLLGYSFGLELFDAMTLVGFLFILIVVVCLLAGLYPAFLISGFNPLEAIKKTGITLKSPGGFSLRSSLVVTQLVISQILVICTLVVASQLKYFIEAPLGLDREAVVEFPLPVKGKDKVEQITNQLQQSTAIRSISFSNTGAISNGGWGGSFEYDNGREVVDESTAVKYVDQNFIDTYGVQLAAGENLINSDSATMFLVNEAFVKSMGLNDNDQAIGEYVKFWGVEAPVVGVLKDFNTSSLHNPIKACIFLTGPNSFFMGAVKLNPTNIEQALAEIQEVWTTVYPNHIFEYQFLDETIERFYREEQKLSKLVKLFVSLAIVIGAMGLFGLVSFVARRRTKEVGVRKVLGASAASVVLLLSRHFVLLTLVAFLIAAPVSYYVMQSWLSNFSFQIDLGVWVFIAGFAASVLIVTLTIGYQTVRSALANPVDSLRYE
ncbi:MAG: ABC transporter permease [Cyclobacteriaceae bacterium]|nr:MAG: ABC transporter permease [Cyclobacteriaceae bacterium]